MYTEETRKKIEEIELRIKIAALVATKGGLTSDNC